ncbi:MAG: ABC transporter permease, partial [Paramuribaculum sp.]|nr:ABC transporter permease [Paramuribaculum sp.]
MNKLSYAFKLMCASRTGTAVKILSIALGLTMCSFIFARIVHDNSIDSCFDDTPTLYQLWMEYTIDGKQLGTQQQCVFPIAYTCIDELSDIVESGTVIGKRGTESIVYNEYITRGDMIITDSLFFKTFGVDIIDGEANVQTTPRTIYISDRLAKVAFKDNSPVGETVMMYDTPFTVKGVFKSWGDETTVSADIIGWLSDYINLDYISSSWSGGDSWFEYIRLKKVPGKDFNEKIQVMVERHRPPTESSSIRVWAQPLRDTFMKSDKVRHMTLTLIILGIAILFVTALNYVLLSISSLSKRAKAIGVYKCSGAKNGTIFSMFLIETLLIILGAVVIGIFFWWLAKRFAAETVFTNFGGYITMDRLWIVLAVIILIFSIAAIIPANLFSKVPVSQVFRRYTEKKHGWKYALLLVEFAGTALVVGMLVVVMTQYKVLMNTDYGYSDDNLVIVVNDGQESQEHTDANMAALKSLPYIEGITRSIAAPSWGYSGEFIRNSAGKELFSSRFDYVCSNYPEVMGMEFVAGKMAPSDSTSVIVNELFAEKIGFTPENAIGQTIKCGSDNVVITGVLKNFKIGSYYNEMMPYIAFNYDRMRHSLFNVQVAEPFERNFELLSDTLPKMMNSGNDLYFQSVRE